MNYLGIDWGERRVGLSYADGELRVATPLEAAVEATAAERLDHISRLIHERRIGALVVGYPLNMDGSEGFKAKEVNRFIAQIEGRFGLPVHRVDERLTSAAAGALSSRKKPRTLRQIQRERRQGTLDSKAAALLLQDFLDSPDLS